MERVGLTQDGRRAAEELREALSELAGQSLDVDEMLAAMRACRLRFGQEYDLSEPEVQAEFLRALHQGEQAQSS